MYLITIDGHTKVEGKTSKREVLNVVTKRGVKMSDGYCQKVTEREGGGGRGGERGREGERVRGVWTHFIKCWCSMSK